MVKISHKSTKSVGLSGGMTRLKKLKSFRILCLVLPFFMAAVMLMPVTEAAADDGFDIEEILSNADLYPQTTGF